MKAYLYDPTGEKARAVQRRYHGVLPQLRLADHPRNGKGDAYAVLPDAATPAPSNPKWTRERVRDAMRAWGERYGTRAVLV